MTTRIDEDSSCGIAAMTNMTFDEVFDKGTPQKSPTIETLGTADCILSSPFASGESSTPAASKSITGKYTDIDHNYDVDPRVIGEGFHGSVRKCTDRVTGKLYAVKTIRKNDPDVRCGSLVREITLLKEMKHHRGVVQLIDVFEDIDYLHIMANGTKGDNACFTEDQASKIIYQILEAVSYMHNHGIVHRDIKPENILFETKDESSPIKIIDFGLARKHYGDRGEPSMKTVVGTPFYVAPEVLRKNYDKACDLWSVGCTAFVLLGGYPPFRGKNNDETHKFILQGRYVFHQEKWKNVSHEAKEFINRLLELDTAKRMTAEEAMNHPWIVRYNNADVVMRVDTYEEVISKGLRLSLPRRKHYRRPSRITRRDIRKAVFGL
ncbi:hypothetical protein ACHAXR_009181 [Thalassiosira sp. AJA248-18]